MNADMQGKRILITGATGGIGLATATALARQGAHVLLVSRDPARCAAAATRITRQTGNTQVSYLAADMSSQQSIRQLAQRFREQYASLDVLINNAGLVFLSRQESIDGIEMTFALNHLGYFLLTTLLLEPLQASAAGRVVSVSSSGHRNATINFADLEGKQRYSGVFAYDQSKLANIEFTYELARRLAPTTVTANCLHPGLVATNFGANNGGIYRWLVRPLLNVISTSPERGAATSVYLAGSSAVSGVTGTYFGNCKAIPSSPISYSKDDWTRLWEVSETYVRA